MDSIFKISKKNSCGITISGLELDNDEYLNADSHLVSKRVYTYKQSTTINVLQHINSEEEEELEEYRVVLHNVDCIDECDMYMKQDGLYAVYHIILPNEVWLLHIIETSKIDMEVYSGVYIYHTKLDKFMKYFNDELVEVSIEEILEINADPQDSEKTTTIIKGSKNTFLLCHLMDCFYGLSSKLLESLPERCPKKDSETSSLILYRDVFWMAINTIKYLLEKGLYFEAARILENVTKCNLICNNKTNKISSSCGCSKK